MSGNLSGKIYYFMRGGVRPSAGAPAVLQGQLVQFMSGGWDRGDTWGLLWQVTKPDAVLSSPAQRVIVTTTDGARVEAIEVDSSSCPTEHNTFY